MPKFILRGYYGFGNLGDDILLTVTYRWLKQHFPACSLSICTDARHPEYLSGILGENLTIYRSDDRVDADWIIYGGGGVFFDFHESGKRYWLLNKIIKQLGYTRYKAIYRAYKVLRGRIGIRGKFQGGLGIGVGTYTKSSRRFYADILSLASFDFLLVRDKQSAENVEGLNLRIPVQVATDLAFFHPCWIEAAYAGHQPVSNQIGFILRDWSYGDQDYFEATEAVAKQLMNEGYAVKFYSFDQQADADYSKRFSNSFPFYAWNPDTLSVNDFLKELARNKLMVTCRAHGAIISACLGIPSICLEIEPKLKEVSAMLKRSSNLIDRPFTEEKIKRAISWHLTSQEELAKAVLTDTEDNFNKIASALARFEKLMRSKESQ